MSDNTREGAQAVKGGPSEAAVSGPRTERFLARVREVARDCGYAIAVHGSLRLERDLDLIAAPWTPEAVSASQLVARLCEEVPLVEHAQPAFMADNPEAKAWGRLAWSLAGCPEHRYVDLSVAPRAGEPVPIHLTVGVVDHAE